MTMTWTSLVAPKGTAGSIMNWVNYSKLDAETVVAEAQSLLFQILRVREMRTTWLFGLEEGESSIDLPARFLDPIGRIRDLTNGRPIAHVIETDVLGGRVYEPLSGDFGAAPFTTVIDTSTVAAALVGHGLTQGSTITIAGASAVGGLTLNGTFPVSSITDDDNLVFDTGETATSSASGGGSGASYTANRLVDGWPSWWSIYDEQVCFDTALDTATQFHLLYYRSPLPLSATNLSNWLTDRYPMLMRTACMAAAASFMKDDGEYNKQLAALQALVTATATENDLSYRGAEFGTENP